MPTSRDGGAGDGLRDTRRMDKRNPGRKKLRQIVTAPIRVLIHQAGSITKQRGGIIASRDDLMAALFGEVRASAFEIYGERHTGLNAREQPFHCLDEKRLRCVNCMQKTGFETRRAIHMDGL
ncbi:hypothetical protein AVEN_44078-1 [Araneus ventricosus]|uniref:Uncharacterized protein n=1 Tax=Araneus ventricosus TaxID=182803 RepID=A0A4Y2CPR0_ARAVE|nr:hypothetical protein AVEN_102054-1 [Araneus ventricosus]GBM05361.1 hypothetical protein AVEN_241696-1 [Araneus ventricosus]GBM26695.1 hypothetical protein AVEN_252730-1 [Araneus ventricosus]GBM26708.1 hypothetical protein AVEN_44078-1 [Araneus ventricosus]